MNLKREAQSLDYPGMRLRFERTVRFVGKAKEPILDIGPDNEFGQELVSALRFSYDFTVGDLDLVEGWYPALGRGLRYDTILCFEVIEHLKNPDLFLRELKYVCTSDATVFVSFPTHRNSKYWSPTHFNEYDDTRAKELFEGAGYEIVRHESYIIPPSVNGIRPILRLPKSLLYLARQHLYELRLK